MSTVKLFIASILIIASSTASAESSTSGSNKNAGNNNGWVSITPDMAGAEYRKAYKHNRKYTQDYVVSYSKNALKSIGIPKAGIKYIGGAAGFAATRDIKLRFGNNKMFALELQNVTESDASLFFGIKKEW